MYSGDPLNSREPMKTVGLFCALLMMGGIRGSHLDLGIREYPRCLRWFRFRVTMAVGGAHPTTPSILKRWATIGAQAPKRACKGEFCALGPPA